MPFLNRPLKQWSIICQLVYYFQMPDKFGIQCRAPRILLPFPLDPNKLCNPVNCIFVESTCERSIRHVHTTQKKWTEQKLKLRQLGHNFKVVDLQTLLRSQKYLPTHNNLVQLLTDDIYWCKNYIGGVAKPILHSHLEGDRENKSALSPYFFFFFSWRYKPQVSYLRLILSKSDLSLYRKKLFQPCSFHFYGFPTWYLIIKPFKLASPSVGIDLSRWRYKKMIVHAKLANQFITSINWDKLPFQQTSPRT